MMPFKSWIELVKWLRSKTKTNDFIIHGSVAMGIYGAPRSSVDVDVAAPIKLFSGVSRVTEVLRDNEFTEWMHAQIIFNAGIVRRFEHKDGWRVDVIEMDKDGYAEILADSNVVPIEGKNYKVISIEQLIKNKQMRGNVRDLDDIVKLKEILKLMQN